MSRRVAFVGWIFLAALAVLARGGHQRAQGNERPAMPFPERQAAEGYFAERPWYGELVAALATRAPAARQVAHELAANHDDDRLVLEAIADWIDQDLPPRTEPRPVVSTSQHDGQTWRYTTEQPADDWYAEAFDDAGWQEGPGGFGTRGTPGAVVRTRWSTADIWLRRSFDLDSADLDQPHLVIHHDEDALIYLNGEKIAEFSGFVTDYFTVPLAGGARRLLRPGRNTLAVYCHQTVGGQYIDVGIVDFAEGAAGVTAADVERVLEAIEAHGGSEAVSHLRARFAELAAALPATAEAWAELYLDAAAARRAARLAPHRDMLRRVVFAKHFNMGASHYAYTEGQSDAQHERHFHPGSALCIMELDGLFASVRTLIDDPHGVVRNPDVSYDGARILFSRKKSDREDDYHLYEMEVATGEVRQLTFGLGFADYEGVYLPNGDIVFNSTRCVQTVDCWWTEVSNLYTCDGDGNFLRRLSFDQVHTNFPTVTEDGRVLYTRWDYNDRGQLFPQPLFQMFPDGTGQTEFYGNNSWFPTTIKHARGIPGTQKVLAIATGHHSFQAGKLCIIDPALGRQENAGVQLIAPVRETRAERIDAYGQEGELFQYPYPLSETEYLVTYDPRGWTGGDRAHEPKFGIYFMTIDGHRELLVRDVDLSSNQPIPLVPRPRPHQRPSTVDYRQDTGTYYMQDVYAGAGLAGIKRGTIQRLRVVALDYRAAGVGQLFGRGPGGTGHPSTPIAVGNGSWDVKVVLGETEVHEDGSALFEVPARTPVYFQALDAKGYAVQTMRSWSTLQPGETFSCVGCHDNKNTTPPAHGRTTLAMLAGAQPLEPFYGEARGFSFTAEIQPILDRHCITCHNDRSIVLAEDSPSLASYAGADNDDLRAFSLLGERTRDPYAKRMWSDAYLNLTRSDRLGGGEVVPLEDLFRLPWRGPDGYEQTSARIWSPNPLVNWISAQSVPTMLPPYYAGAANSRLMHMLEEGHHGVELSREEMERIACWIDLLVPYCGDYREANAWSEEEVQKYDHFLEKRQRMEAIERENIAALIRAIESGRRR